MNTEQILNELFEYVKENLRDSCATRQTCVPNCYAYWDGKFDAWQQMKNQLEIIIANEKG